jgi:CubicO group peptidase (beta-lactamase class C family)
MRQPLRNLLETTVESGTVPGVAALVAHGGDVEIAGVGEVEPGSIVRIASMTKPITAAAVMLLVDEGLVALDDPIARWLPELASPGVVRTLESAIDDVVPAARPITVEDLLTFRAGWGFPSDFSLPAVVELFQKLPVFGPRETPDEWLATLAQVPMLRQPGEAWLYNTCSDVQGVLIARVSGEPLPEFLVERIFEPLGMTDTGFHVPLEKLDRLPPYRGPDLAPIEDGLWTEPPIFPSGSGGLVSTLADWHRFGRMLLADGGGLLSPRSVRLMTTDHLTQEQRQASTLFLEGAGWGFGGAVAGDGRYGWVGGTGTAAHVVPSTGTVGILLTQVRMAGPTPTRFMREFWQYAFGDSGRSVGSVST